MRERRRLFAVGLPKTGTTSLHALFRGYRSAHEFMFEETVTRALAWHAGAPEGELAVHLVRRDRIGGLRMDSASFHHLYPALLADLFPDARFVHAMRDPYDWANSFLNMLLRWHRGCGGVLPEWQVAYGRFLFGWLDGDALTSAEALAAVVPARVDGLIRCWGDGNRRVLEQVPAERRLAVRTERLSSSLEEIAAFAEVPVSSLQEAHANVGTGQVDLLAAVGRTYVEERCRALYPDVVARC